jgi:hypothetical protein
MVGGVGIMNILSNYAQFAVNGMVGMIIRPNGNYYWTGLDGNPASNEFFPTPQQDGDVMGILTAFDWNPGVTRIQTFQFRNSVLINGLSYVFIPTSICVPCVAFGDDASFLVDSVTANFGGDPRFPLIGPKAVNPPNPDMEWGQITLGWPAG